MFNPLPFESVPATKNQNCIKIRQKNQSEITPKSRPPNISLAMSLVLAMGVTGNFFRGTNYFRSKIWN